MARNSIKGSIAKMIDREKVRKGLEWILDGDRFGFGENWHIDSEPKTEEEQAGYNIQRAIELLKEQEPRTAHWFISEYEYLTCSHCGESYYTDAESTEDAKQRLANGDYYKFCPYCGAKMTDRR